MTKQGDPEGRFWLKLTLSTAACAIAPFLPWFAGMISSARDGDEISVSGIVITIGGFIGTLWQLSRTKAASVAARQAVTTLQLRVAAIEDSVLCESCLSSAIDIERSNAVAIQQPTAASYMFLPERYRELRLQLVRFRERQEGHLTNEQLTSFTDVVSKLSEAQMAVPKALAMQTPKLPNLGPLQHSVHRISELLSSMAERLSTNVIDA